jgi:hypothetical protein
MVNPSGSAIVNNFTIIINRVLEKINELHVKIDELDEKNSTTGNKNKLTLDDLVIHNEATINQLRTTKIFNNVTTILDTQATRHEDVEEIKNEVDKKFKRLIITIFLREENNYTTSEKEKIFDDYIGELLNKKITIYDLKGQSIEFSHKNQKTVGKIIEVDHSIKDKDMELIIYYENNDNPQDILDTINHNIIIENEENVDTIFVNDLHVSRINKKENSGQNSAAFGSNTHSEGNNSAAFGHSTKAHGANSAAFGQETQANGVNSTAFGKETTSLGVQSVAFGYKTKADGEFSATFGNNTHVVGNSSAAFGQETEAKGTNSAAFGYKTHSEGNNSAAFGDSTEANHNNSAAFGDNTKATGPQATAFGIHTIASGEGSAAFGSNTHSEGNNSAAFGYKTTSHGVQSVAFGQETQAKGTNSAAFGNNTHVDGHSSVAFGKYNSNKTALFVIGNGENDDHRNDAFLVDNNNLHINTRLQMNRQNLYDNSTLKYSDLTSPIILHSGNTLEFIIDNEIHKLHNNNNVEKITIINSNVASELMIHITSNITGNIFLNTEIVSKDEKRLLNGNVYGSIDLFIGHLKHDTYFVKTPE